MPAADPEAQWETILRPFRRVAAALSVVQTLGLLALVVVLLLADAGLKGVGYALAAGILILEVAQWGLSRAALRRCPGFEPGDRYVLRPLDPAQLRLVDLNLITTAFAPVVLALIVPTTSFKNEKLVVFLLLFAAMVPTGLSLWRVRRNRSWLAISRIPACPRRHASL
jgi:hypothetical protein